MIVFEWTLQYSPSPFGLIAVIILKNDAEIEKMRHTGKLVAAAHREVALNIRPGVSLSELHAIVVELYRHHAAESVFRLRQPHGETRLVPCLLSLNSRLGTPVDDAATLTEGDILTLDTGCRLDGWCAEAAWSYPVGRISCEKQTLLDALQFTRELLDGLLSRRQSWREIALALQHHVRSSGLRLIDDVIGHGIGQELHEDPQLAWNLGETSLVEFPVMRPGMVLAVEWGLTTGKGALRRLENGGWETYDRSPCVHGEMTVACTAAGIKVLTDAA
ncbi:MAG: M24 family metallopeptidase [Planctomycetaceae bacterium]